MTQSSKTSRERPTRRRDATARQLDRVIDETLVDAYTESEQLTAFYTVIDDNLITPFATAVLGVEVVVTEVELTEDDQIVAVCRRGKSVQRIPILDLPLPVPSPGGVQWVDAYRRWARPRR